MCGIAGALHLDGTGAVLEAVKVMSGAIAHRGPDGEGYYVDGPCGLGHRRLAIIDLSEKARQPMHDASGRFFISYNGEIYNFGEIRRQLERKGVLFRTKSDTEVLVNAFAIWGYDAIPRLNGMFAFAVWDCVEHRLTLARDRFGVKPLYYCELPGCLLFGSEIKAILADPRYKTNLDCEGLLEYLTFQNYFTQRTLFKGIRLLPSGSYLSASGRRGTVDQPTTYWDFDFREPTEPSDDKVYLEELDHLFKQAVHRQLVSDVELGAYLSGGLDSGSITALASRQLPYIKSFTCGFDLSSASGLELPFDEREAAEHMSYRFKTEHYEMVLKAGDMERVMPRIGWHIEEPRVGQSYPNFYIAQLASKFVKVAQGSLRPMPVGSKARASTMFAGRSSTPRPGSSRCWTGIRSRHWLRSISTANRTGACLYGRS